MENNNHMISVAPSVQKLRNNCMCLSPTLLSCQTKSQCIFLVQNQMGLTPLVFLSINCFVNLVKENLPYFLLRTISICLYFAQSRLYKRFNFEVEVSLGKFWKQVCITSQSGRPTREIWRKKAIEKICQNWKQMFSYTSHTEIFSYASSSTLYPYESVGRVSD